MTSLKYGTGVPPGAARPAPAVELRLACPRQDGKHAGSKDFDGLAPKDQQRFSGIMGMLVHRLEGFVTASDRRPLPPDAWDGAVNRPWAAFALPGTRSCCSKGASVFDARSQTRVNEEIVGAPATSSSTWPTP